MHEDGVAMGHVESLVLEGQPGDVTGPEAGVTVAAGVGRGPRHVDLRGLDVDPVQLARRDRLRQAHRNRPGPAPEVEKLHSWPQVREQMEGDASGVPAREHAQELLAVPHRVRGRIGSFAVLGCHEQASSSARRTPAPATMCPVPGCEVRSWPAVAGEHRRVVVPTRHNPYPARTESSCKGARRGPRSGRPGSRP